MTSPARANALRHMRLRPPPHRGGAFPTYDLAERAQTVLQQRLRAWKAAGRRPGLEPPPPPTLLSFTPAPTYTLGRRQTAPLGPDATARLTRPLEVAAPVGEPGVVGGGAARRTFRPSVHAAPRGGLATYHGPGQLVLWPVIDLHSPAHRHFTVQGYACLLEKTTMAALRLATGHFRPAREDGAPGGPARTPLDGFTDPENPGVWVNHRTFPPPPEHGCPGTAAAAEVRHAEDGEETPTMTGEARKIAALGVHLRRHVTGLGVAINCDVAVAGPEPENPWARIVPCGIEGKGVTSVRAEMGGPPRSADWSDEFMRYLASSWATLFAESLYGEKAPVLHADPETLELDLEADDNWTAGDPRE